MDFSQVVGKDITVHTEKHKYRGVLKTVLSTENGAVTILCFEVGVDTFFIDAKYIIAATIHGREFGTDGVVVSD